MTLYITIILITSAVLAAIGQLMFRVGAEHQSSVVGYINIWIACGLLAYSFGMLLWMYVLSKHQITNVYAFTILTYVLVMLGGVFALGETLDTNGLIGSAIVLFGLVVIVTKPFS